VKIIITKKATKNVLGMNFGFLFLFFICLLTTSCSAKVSTSTEEECSRVEANISPFGSNIEESECED